jgi:hypothetical protein
MGNHKMSNFSVTEQFHEATQPLSMIFFHTEHINLPNCMFNFGFNLFSTDILVHKNSMTFWIFLGMRYQRVKKICTS